MAGVKSLAKDTVVYGASSIIGRFLNWCLVPLYTGVFAASQYGLVTYIYSIVALALIVLTYGMETGFFRFANHDDFQDRPMEVYSTALTSLGVSSGIFLVAVLVFQQPVSNALECRGHEDYIALMATAVAIDAFTAIPFSYLRYARRPIRFATLKVISIFLNIGLNLFWILLCPWLDAQSPGCVSWCWSPDYGIGYIFLANLISSAAMLVLLYPELHGFPWRFNSNLWRRMLVYSWPLLVLGIAGIMNQTIDKILFPYLFSDKAQAMQQLGIYGANYKIAIVMVMFIQAFRFAYEPFIFSRKKGQQMTDRYAEYRSAMKWFVIAAMVIFLAVMFYLDILRYFISPRYFSGLKVVPIIMLAEFFFGIFFNLSLWYKLTDQTRWGMWFSLGGLCVTLALNILLVPYFGYMGCAWAAFACYGCMMIASYIVGRIKHPIGYNVPRLLCYFGGALLLWGVAVLTTTGYRWFDMLVVRTPLLLLYVYVALRAEGISLSRLRQRV